jgi:hypothetical protein
MHHDPFDPNGSRRQGKALLISRKVDDPAGLWRQPDIGKSEATTGSYIRGPIQEVEQDFQQFGDANECLLEAA